MSDPLNQNKKKISDCTSSRKESSAPTGSNWTSNEGVSPKNYTNEEVDLVSSGMYLRHSEGMLYKVAPSQPRLSGGKSEHSKIIYANWRLQYPVDICWWKLYFGRLGLASLLCLLISFTPNSRACRGGTHSFRFK
jgi:hypothetical protein